MSRSKRAAVAKETVAILDRAEYELPDGRCISIRQELDACLAGTTFWPPEKLQPLLDESFSAPKRWPSTRIEILNETTLAGAYRLVQSQRFSHIAALNFASAKNPGGGFLGGARAQEESLARGSALYGSLLRAKEYYDFHRRQHSALYSDRMIWTPHCPVIRNDGEELLSEPHCVSFVTSAAPNAGAIATNRSVDLPQIPTAFERRIARVLALAHGHGVDALVLGAWGCGAFRNDPRVVAPLFAQALRPGGDWHGRFHTILFSVLDTSSDLAIFRAFADALSTS